MKERFNSAGLYIFDMDGTLLDSMPAWKHLGHDYLLTQGILPPQDLEAKINAMTIEESAAYFQTLGLLKDIKKIRQEMLDLIYDAYYSTIPAKQEVADYLIYLSQNADTPICLLTTSDRDYAVQAMKRLNLYHYFDRILTSTQLQLSKRTGEIYRTVCSLYHVSPKDTIVLEDALYAIRAAKEAGCYVCAVPDASSQDDYDQICQTADAVFDL